MKQDMENRKPKVAFVCVHNSCRSQMAEALGKAIAADTFISCSAGTEIRNQINPDALRLMKQNTRSIWNRHSIRSFLTKCCR